MAIGTLKEAIEKYKRNIRWNEKEIELHREEIKEKITNNAQFEHRIIQMKEAIRELEK